MPDFNSTIKIAVGTSRLSTRWTTKELTWGSLAQKLSQVQRTAETIKEYHRLPKAEKARIKDVGGFVGGVLTEGRRTAEAVKNRQLLTLDMDDLKPSDDPWDVVESLMGNAAVLYSTHSHTDTQPRLRLVMPLSRPATPDEYVALAHLIAGDIGSDLCDDSTYQPHRLMYWPSAPCDAPYVYKRQDGPWLDVDEQLARYDDWRDPSEWPVSSRMRADAFKRVASKQGDPESKPGIVGAFCRTYDVPQAIEAFLPEIYTPCNDSGTRYTYQQGSTVGGLVIYENGRFAYSHHGTDPSGGRLCNAFDLVRIHLFHDLDESAELGTPINKLPSYKAMSELAYGDSEVAREMARANRESVVALFDDSQEGEGGTEADNADTQSVDNSWLDQLTTEKDGSFSATINNVLLIMLKDPRIAGRYYYDEFASKPVVCGDLPWIRLADRLGSMWLDADDAGLRNTLEHDYGIANVAKVKDAVSLAMQANRRHPVRDYLRGLVWDGTNRVEELLINYLGAADTRYVRTVTRKTMVGAVARIMQPGCKLDTMLVLVGPQGGRKSTLLDKLGGKWFSDSQYTIQGKDAYELIQGRWIIEMGELAALKKATRDQVKLFISKREDTYRTAYAIHTETHPRQCIFFGTANDDHFIVDDTGGRRFWPVDVAKLESNPVSRMTQDDVDQLWAEAVWYYDQGETWYLDEVEDERAAELVQAEHTQLDPRTGMVEAFLRRPIHVDWYKWSLQQRVNWLNGTGDFEVAAEAAAYLYDPDRPDRELPAHLMYRKKICALEVWVEVLGGSIHNFDKAKSLEINSILKQLPGWSKSTPDRFGADYGNQRCFKLS